ncbi:Glycosyltransferase involved in cell wall bisynthesis [Noviherbaspirillum humi]|uniref:Glycosyltransferase involved in cell wall bisynthesis n=1 Tax=Noviherbaspirillum humi TaxID=1688639 RepID=A0A239CWC1_9BURK|nr:hypothetical protein [Noviherbaspirillum humi]SNS23844.1 Glycosyltransferase involved in cell wall bisynthesis [Noviherbaspirillum humi]
MRLIYLSPVPWNSFSQRPHEMATYFHAATGGKVTWIDPYPTRLPTVADLLRKTPPLTGADAGSPDWLELLRPRALPIEPLPGSGMVNRFMWRDVLHRVRRVMDGQTLIGVGKPSELAIQLLRRGPRRSAFYDAMDDFPAFYSGFSQAAMAGRERQVAQLADTVITSSHLIQRRFGQFKQDVRLVMNACASDRLPARRPRLPSANGPVIGYVGTIAAWFDWEMVAALARALPTARIRLIGPLYQAPPFAVPPNLSIEPPLPHAEALQVMNEFDIGLIPFKQTPLTASVDPIKFYEYRAMGLPILSTAFGEMALRGELEGVCLAGPDSDFQSLVHHALTLAASEQEVQVFRLANSWSSRFASARLFS